MIKRRMKVTQIGKKAFVFLVNSDRDRFDIDPLTPEQEEKTWKRAQKHAPASTKGTVSLCLSPFEVDLLKREGYKTKTKYIPF